MSNILINKMFEGGLPEEWPSGKRVIFIHLAERYNEKTQKSYPGLDELKKVSGLSKSVILGYIRELCNDRFLTRITRGKTGTRAEFKVTYFQPLGLPRVVPEQLIPGDSGPAPQPVLADLRKRLAENSRKYGSRDPKHINTIIKKQAFSAEVSPQTDEKAS